MTPTTLTLKAKHFHNTSFFSSSDCAMAKAAKDTFKGFKPYEMVDKILLVENSTGIEYYLNHEPYNNTDFEGDQKQANKWYNRLFKRTPIRTVELTMVHGTWNHASNPEQKYHAVQGRLTLVPVQIPLTDTAISKYGYFSTLNPIMGNPYEVEPAEVPTDPTEVPPSQIPDEAWEPIIVPDETIEEEVITTKELEELVREATEEHLETASLDDSILHEYHRVQRLEEEQDRQVMRLHLLLT